MKAVVTLLKPRILSFKFKRFSSDNKDALIKLSVFGTIGILFWGGIFAVSLRVLGYFRGIEELGGILAYKLLSMILLKRSAPGSFHAGFKLQDIYCKVDREHH